MKDAISQDFLDINGENIWDVNNLKNMTPFETEPVRYRGTLHRVGFKIHVPERHRNNEDYVHDPRPICWPIYHPYYVTGQEDGAMTMMAYVIEPTDVFHYWPDATDLTIFEEKVTHYYFSERFPRPDWLDDVHKPENQPVKRIGAYKIEDIESGLSSIGFSDDVDYDIQLNVHQLEYGTHDHAELQEAYISAKGLEIKIYDTKTLEDAEIYAKKLIITENSNGEYDNILEKI